MASLAKSAVRVVGSRGDAVGASDMGSRGLRERARQSRGDGGWWTFPSVSAAVWGLDRVQRLKQGRLVMSGRAGTLRCLSHWHYLRLAQDLALDFLLKTVVCQ